MQPHRAQLWRIWPTLLAFAIVSVIALQGGPRLALGNVSMPVVCSLEQSAPEDALKVGQRLEPRVFPAPLLDRLPATPSSRLLGAVDVEAARFVPLAADTDGRSAGDTLPIVKHVPRMERGDPPRI